MPTTCPQVYHRDTSQPIRPRCRPLSPDLLKTTTARSRAGNATGRTASGATAAAVPVIERPVLQENKTTDFHFPTLAEWGAAVANHGNMLSAPPNFDQPHDRNAWVHYVMGDYPALDVQVDNDTVIPFYSWLAKQFTFCDHHFGLGTNSTPGHMLAVHPSWRDRNWSHGRGLAHEQAVDEGDARFGGQDWVSENAQPDRSGGGMSLLGAAPVGKWVSTRMARTDRRPHHREVGQARGRLFRPA